jgi:hypothetical protein
MVISMTLRFGTALGDHKLQVIHYLYVLLRLGNAKRNQPLPYNTVATNAIPEFAHQAPLPLLHNLLQHQGPTSSQRQ